MNALSLIAVSAPKDLWSKLIYWIQGAFGNFGWTILFVTLLVKLIMTPLEFMVKYSNKKQNLVQKKLSPQIAKIKKKFGSNQEQIRIQTQSLYKREGFKAGLSCIVMAVNMLATMLVFFTFYSSLRKVSSYEMITQYETLQQTFTNEYIVSLREKTGDESIVDTDSANTWYNTNLSNSELPNFQENASLNQAAIAEAEQATLECWKGLKENWLWVNNIWVADAPTSSLPTYDKLVSSSTDGNYDEYVEDNIGKEAYTTIANIIVKNSDRKQNGFLILTILVGVLSFLSQWIADLHTKLRNKKAQKLAKEADPTEKTMKIMKIITPLIMVGFSFSSSAAFSLYLIASSIASIAFGEVIALIVKKLTKKQQAEVEEILEKEANRLIKKGKLQEN